jgi:hypothetical protein
MHGTYGGMIWTLIYHQTTQFSVSMFPLKYLALDTSLLDAMAIAPSRVLRFCGYHCGSVMVCNGRGKINEAGQG